MPPNLLDGAIVTFQNYGSETVMDLRAGSNQDGTPIIGYHEMGNGNQQWRLIQAKTGGVWPIWKIRNVAGGTFIDLFAGDSHNGTPINGYNGDPKDSNDTKQLWRFVTVDPSGPTDSSSELVRIQNIGTNTYIDLKDGNSKDETKIHAWEGNILDENRNQIWRMKLVKN